MNGQDLLTATHIGQGDIHLAVKATRAQQSGVKDVRAVGGRHDDDAHIGLEPVHLDEHLVECLLALIIAAAQTRTAVSAHGIDFIDEDDARRTFLGLLEHVAHASSPYTHKHFDEIRA